MADEKKNRSFEDTAKAEGSTPETTGSSAVVTGDVVDLSAEETENLKSAIEQVVADETAVLPHVEQLSTAVTEEIAPDTTEAAATAAVSGESRVSSWFITFMCMNLPFIGWIYLIYLAFNKRKTDRRNFARAYIFYKLIFLVLGLIIFCVLLYTAMNFLEELLEYMQML